MIVSQELLFLSEMYYALVEEKQNLRLLNLLHLFFSLFIQITKGRFIILLEWSYQFSG